MTRDQFRDARESIASHRGEPLVGDRPDVAGRLLRVPYVEEAGLVRAVVRHLQYDGAGLHRQVVTKRRRITDPADSDATLADIWLADDRKAPAVRSDRGKRSVKPRLNRAGLDQRPWQHPRRRNRREDLALRFADDAAVSDAGIAGAA